MHGLFQMPKPVWTPLVVHNTSAWWIWSQAFGKWEWQKSADKILSAVTDCSSGKSSRLDCAMPANFWKPNGICAETCAIANLSCSFRQHHSIRKNFRRNHEMTSQSYKSCQRSWSTVQSKEMLSVSQERPIHRICWVRWRNCDWSWQDWWDQRLAKT